MAHLNIKFSERDNRTERFKIATNSQIAIGRSQSNQYIIKHRSISRNHASLSFDGNAAFITDLNSENGLYVYGKRQKKVKLIKPNGCFYLGSLKIDYSLLVNFDEESTTTVFNTNRKVFFWIKDKLCFSASTLLKVSLVLLCVAFVSGSIYFLSNIAKRIDSFEKALDEFVYKPLQSTNDAEEADLIKKVAGSQGTKNKYYIDEVDKAFKRADAFASEKKYVDALRALPPAAVLNSLELSDSQRKVVESAKGKRENFWRKMEGSKKNKKLNRSSKHLVSAGMPTSILVQKAIKLFKEGKILEGCQLLSSKSDNKEMIWQKKKTLLLSRRCKNLNAIAGQ